MLVVLITIASAGPAMWSHNTDLVREQVIQLLLAALATALCIVERSYRQKASEHDPRPRSPRPTGTPFSPWR